MRLGGRIVSIVQKLNSQWKQLLKISVCKWDAANDTKERQKEMQSFHSYRLQSNGVKTGSLWENCAWVDSANDGQTECTHSHASVQLSIQ